MATLIGFEPTLHFCTNWLATNPLFRLGTMSYLLGILTIVIMLFPSVPLIIVEDVYSFLICLVDYIPQYTVGTGINESLTLLCVYWLCMIVLGKLINHIATSPRRDT